MDVLVSLNLTRLIFNSFILAEQVKALFRVQIGHTQESRQRAPTELSSNKRIGLGSSKDPGDECMDES